ncbi:MAG: condensation domain-containing protein, partial [Acidobacteriaceae bacterium]
MGEEASCCYNESFTLKLRGALNVSALASSIDKVIARHEALRATFDPDGEFQQFASELKLAIPLEDLSALDDQSREERLAEIIGDDASTPFDLERGPLVRANLILLKPGEHHLIFTAHHIVCDGWSTNVILGELCMLYSAACAGQTCELPQPMAFSSYADSQTKYFGSAEVSAAETFWQEQFREPAAFLELPLDRPRPASRTYPGATCRLRIPAESYRDIKRAGARQKCTLFVTLLAGFQILLSRLSGQKDIVVGIPAAGQSMFEGVSLVGHCVNFLPLRGCVADDLSAAQFLSETRRTLLDAYDHQNYTYGRLLRKLPIKRDPSRLPLTEIQFNLERVGSGTNFAGLGVTIEPNAKSFVNQDLFLNVIESSDGLMLDCDYNTGLFDYATIERWLGHYATLLTSMSADANHKLSELALLSPAERMRFVDGWNDTRADFPIARGVHQLFEVQAARIPDAVAAVYENEQLTYFELNRRA